MSLGSIGLRWAGLAIVGSKADHSDSKSVAEVGPRSWRVEGLVLGCPIVADRRRVVVVNT